MVTIFLFMQHPVRGPAKSNPSCQISTLEGPIPVGAYHANPKELSDPNMLQQINLLLRYGDWGDWNIPLYPSPATNTHGRSGFYIHGGIWEGSAGCIDIGGGFNRSSETDKLKNMIQKEIFVSIEVKI